MDIRVPWTKDVEVKNPNEIEGYVCHRSDRFGVHLPERIVTIELARFDSQLRPYENWYSLVELHVLVFNEINASK